MFTIVKVIFLKTYFLSEPRTVTLIPGDGIGPEIAVAVQKIFAAAEAPIAWEPVDVTPVKNPDGTMGIPQAVIDSVNKHKIGLKSPLMTPVGKGFRYCCCFILVINSH